MLGLGFTFKQGIGQLEPLMFVGPGIEEFIVDASATLYLAVHFRLLCRLLAARGGHPEGTDCCRDAERAMSSNERIAHE